MRVEEGFLQTNVDLGFIFAGKNYTAKYPYRNIKIDKVEASCDCLYVENEDKVDRLLIQYKPKYPKHLEENGVKQYDSQKSIKVFYRSKDKPEEQKLAVLMLIAKVMKN